MTDKELQKLSRTELLELLLVQSKELEKANNELESLRQQLQKREISLSQTGNIAEAALKLTGIFESAQAAADLYLENIRKPNKLLEDTQAQCDEMLRSTRQSVMQVWQVVRREIYNPKLDYAQWQQIANYIDEQLKLK